MIQKLFGNAELLQKGLDAAWLRNDVITNNIANAETPDFKGSSVQFETLFKSALEKEQQAQQTPAFETKRTRDKHISFSPEESMDAPQDIEPVVVRNGESSMRLDGNNVDIEAENVALARNTILYYTLTSQLNSEFARLSMAINEGK